MAVFVCFSVRAIHIEVVADLTTAAFIAALKRFAGRRGVPSRIYSDNATNFVDASRLLINGNKEIESYASTEGIEWKFIPPRTPNQGRLREVAIKAVKVHLTKISSGTQFTFEELNTVTAEIEAVLNDRPLGYKDDGSDGVRMLTPSSFLVGSKLNQVVIPETAEISLSR